jgi:hypothetical protein
MSRKPDPVRRRPAAWSETSTEAHHAAETHSELNSGPSGMITIKTGVSSPDQ